MDYAFIHNDVAFTPNGTKLQVKDAEAHNAAIEAAELAQWALKPDAWAGYVIIDKPGMALTTWRGINLGIVFRGRSYRNNFGARITSLVVKGTNGATYYGRYAEDSTQFIRLRKRTSLRHT